LASNSPPIGIIDLGGTKIYSAVVAGDGTVQGEDLRETNAPEGQEAVLEAMTASISAAASHARFEVSQLCGVGVAAPGPVDADRGSIVNAPNLPDWEDVPLAEILSRRLGMGIVVENDANAAALGEYLQGAGRGARALLYVTVSTGIGGGIVLNGELYRGASGAAGEIGHMIVQIDGPRCGCGNLGCLEALASGTALARDGRAAVEAGEAPVLAGLTAQAGDEISAEMVAQAASQGEQASTALLLRAGETLGIGLGSLVNLINPDVIVIGGGMSKIGMPLLGPAEAMMREIAFPIAGDRVSLRRATLDFPALHGLSGLVRAAIA
jgi:glucokinase